MQTPSNTAESETDVPAWRRIHAALTPEWTRRLPGDRWGWCLAAFALVWTIELFMVQKLTLIPAQSAGPRFELVAPWIRLLLDATFVGFFAIVMWRWALGLIAIATLVADVILLTYFHYFHRPLSLLTLVNNFSEGLEVTGMGLQVVPLAIWPLLILVLVAKLLLLFAAGPPQVSGRRRFAAAGALAACYVAIFAVTLQLDPLSKILTTRGVGRLGLIRGYLGPWWAEFHYLGNAEILSRALAEREQKTDRLSGVEAVFPLKGPLVVIQAESLDLPILGYRVNGQEVTPFLNELRKRSMMYRIHAIHSNGSADADFAALNGVPPSTDVLNYNIPGYPYDSTLPQFLATMGYQTEAFHGNSGNFYNRRAAFDKMGFSALYFEEDLVGQFGFDIDEMGVRDPDMLRVAAERLRQQPPNTCQFIITLTSHTPFNLVPPAEREIYPHESGLAEGYFNSMRYLDNALRDYVEMLPDGTTVMIYGDHAAGIQTPDYESDRQGANDCVPCFFFQKGVDLSQVQTTRDAPIATDGSLTLVDVTAYLRHAVAADRARQAAGPKAE